MGDFRILVEARDWFGELRKGNRQFKIDFDPFYFCFMAGLTAGQKRSVAQNETAQLVDYFPGAYASRGRLLVALFLSRELRELGVEMTQRDAVNTALSELIDPNAKNYLSDSGIREFNGYACGGYSVLLDWFDDKPRNLETFLRMFKRCVDETLEKG